MPAHADQPGSTAWAAAALAVAAPVGVVLACAGGGGAGGAATARALYLAMPALLAFAAWAAVRALGERGWRRTARTHAGGLAVAIAAAASCFALVPASARVEWDETDLLAASRGMHEQRACLVAVAALPDGRAPLVVESMLDKRPPLFPFLASVLHDAFGFRTEHAFLVNALALGLLLAAVHGWVRARAGATAAAAAACWLLAAPLTVVCATSGGMELLAAALLAVVLRAAAALAAAPTPAALQGFVAAAALCCYARYESVAVSAVAAALVLWRLRGRLPVDRAATIALGLVPGLLAPLALQLVHATDRSFYAESGGGALFGIEHAARHLPRFAAAFFDPRTAGVYPGALALLAVAAGAVALARRRWTFEHTLVAAPVLAALAIALAWFYGEPTEPAAQRLYLPPALLGALGPVLLLMLLRPRRAAALAVLGAGIAVAALQAGRVRAGAVFPALPAVRVAAAIDRVLPRVAGMRENAVVVSAVAPYLVLRGFAALSPAAFERRRGELRYQRNRGRLEHVLFLETAVDAELAPQFGSVRALRESVPTTELAASGAERLAVVRRLDERPR